MNNEELNKRIHELLGFKWYEGDSADFGYNYEFTKEWRAFGYLWEWWQKQEKWEDFLFESDSEMCCIGLKYVSPRGLAEATVEFFKEDSGK